MQITECRRDERPRRDDQGGSWSNCEESEELAEEKDSMNPASFTAARYTCHLSVGLGSNLSDIAGDRDISPTAQEHQQASEVVGRHEPVPEQGSQQNHL